MLSAVWAGLGHAYIGRPGLGILLGVVGLVFLVVFGSLLLEGPEILLGRLFDRGFVVLVLALLAASAAFRIGVLLHAVAVASRRARWRRRHGIVALVLAAVLAVAHALPGYVAWSIGEAGSRVFVGRGDGASLGGATLLPQPTATGADPGAAPATPLATPFLPPVDDRLTVLFLGVDSGPGRAHALTDTMLVASADSRSGRATMVSFPRDIASFPLWDGRIYEGKLNSLMSWAAARTDQFPRGGGAALRDELSYLLGIPIDHYAAVNLEGFVRLVELVGGVDVVNPHPIDDPTYEGEGFHMPAGRVHLDTTNVLPFVRSRKGDGDNDFTRAARQQAVLAGLRSKLTDPSMIARLPELIEAADELLDTDIPADQVDEMLRVVSAVDADAAERVVLGPPYSWHPPMTETAGIYELRLDLDRVADLSRRLFGQASRYSSGS
jgi:LCP family protein required for cell wall assembly